MMSLAKLTPVAKVRDCSVPRTPPKMRVPNGNEDHGHDEDGHDDLHEADPRPCGGIDGGPLRILPLGEEASPSTSGASHGSTSLNFGLVMIFGVSSKVLKSPYMLAGPSGFLLQLAALPGSRARSFLYVSCTFQPMPNFS